MPRLKVKYFRSKEFAVSRLRLRLLLSLLQQCLAVLHLLLLLEEMETGLHLALRSAHRMQISVGQRLFSTLHPNLRATLLCLALGLIDQSRLTWHGFGFHHDALRFIALLPILTRLNNHGTVLIIYLLESLNMRPGLLFLIPGNRSAYWSGRLRVLLDSFLIGVFLRIFHKRVLVAAAGSLDRADVKLFTLNGLD